MANITKDQYDFALAKVEELLPQVDDNTPADDPKSVELVSSMLQSLLLNAGYDTLGNVIDRIPQQLSKNISTNQTCISELKRFIERIGLI